MEKVLKELADFLAEWQETPDKNKSTFIRFKENIVTKQHVVLDYQPRPGLTYSLRAAHSEQTEKPLFVMVDVIEDTPRWLSICFYGDMISDPEEKGAFVPGGLLGEDALCFDIDAFQEAEIEYVEARIEEAYQSAAGN